TALGGSALGDPLGPALGRSPLGARPAARKQAGGSGKIVWIAAGAVGVLLLLAGVGVIASGVLSRSTAPPPQTPMASDAPTAELPAWSADTALLNQLGGETSFDRYSLRLPPGYQPLNLTAARRAPPGVKRQTWVWCDAAAADGTRHVIEASLADASDIITHRNDLDAEVNAYLQNAQADANSAKFAPGTTAKGQVCGGPFARLTYSVATPQATVHTISFLGFDGNDRMLTLVCAGKEPEGTEAFKLLEASLLSLKRN
ncbi:MAG TPA: hypothetical protein VF278_03830, partial [Pirellulales bacterium]